MASLEYTTGLAINKARQSHCRYKISAIGLDKSGNVIGSACNKKRFNYEGGGVHAEMALLRKYGKKIKSMVICRVNKEGNLLKINSCKTCQKTLDNLGIKVYSIW